MKTYCSIATTVCSCIVYGCFGATTAELGSCDHSDPQSQTCLLSVPSQKKFANLGLGDPSDIAFRHQKFVNIRYPTGKDDEGKITTWSPLMGNQLCFREFYLLSVSHPNVTLPTMSITPSMDIRKAACW